MSSADLRLLDTPSGALFQWGRPAGSSRLGLVVVEAPEATGGLIDIIPVSLDHIDKDIRFN